MTSSIFSSTIDLCIPSFYRDKICFFHIDVEGFEFGCIQGAAKLISESRSIIVYEQWLSEDVVRSNEILDYLSAFDYEFTMINELTGARGDCRNILASPKELGVSSKLVSDKYKNVTLDPFKKRVAVYPYQWVFDGPPLVPIIKKDGAWEMPIKPWDADFLFPAIGCAANGKIDEAFMAIKAGLAEFPGQSSLVYAAICLTDNDNYEDFLDILSRDRLNSALGYILKIERLIFANNAEQGLRAASDALSLFHSDSYLHSEILRIVKAWDQPSQSM